MVVAGYHSSSCNQILAGSAVIESLAESKGQNGFYFFFFFKKIVFLKIYLFLMERSLLANIVLVSAIYQHESAIGVHMSPPS